MSQRTVPLGLALEGGGPRRPSDVGPEPSAPSMFWGRGDPCSPPSKVLWMGSGPGSRDGGLVSLVSPTWDSRVEAGAPGSLASSRERVVQFGKQRFLI